MKIISEEVLLKAIGKYLVLARRVEKGGVEHIEMLFSDDVERPINTVVYRIKI